MSAKNRELPAKESAIFKTVLKYYENRQYKKGIKATDTILKKFPNHGESLAMKGLFCSHLERRDEAHELIKKGIVCDMTSHICWHVYGLVHRAERNYEEAIKCYIRALKFDKNNAQIMRDYSTMQIQTRNYEAFNEIRHQILTARPNLRANWISLAVSYHLLTKYDTAERIITTYWDSTTSEVVGPLDEFENSELHMYQNMIIEESGNFEAALVHLEKIRSKVIVMRAWREAKARILLKANQHAKAQVEYERLLGENPDSLEYLEGYRQARGLGGDLEDRTDLDRALRMFKELGEKYPRSHVIQRMPLKFVSGDEFKAMAEKYLVALFRKGVPSLFVSLKDLMADAEKERILGELALGFYESLKANGTFGPDDKDKEPPTAYVWVAFFVAQLYDRRGDTMRALEVIDEVIEHSPTVVDLYMVKARILKHGGDLARAKATMDFARQIDLQDRFLNTKSTKYMLANNEVSEAETTMALFTKQEDSSDPLAALVSMQCMWFLIARGEAYLRLGNHGRALKQFHLIQKTFDDIYEDQVDFHTYSLRKSTIRAYVDLLRTEDTIRAHPFFAKAAKGAVRAYLELHDGPQQSNVTIDGVDLSTLSESERKKALRKARKAELKSQSEQTTAFKQDVSGPAAASTGTGNNNNNNKKKPAPVDPDPEGKKLIEGVDHLAEAVKFLVPLQEFSPEDIDGWLLGAEVYLRKKKLLLALRSLKHAHEHDASHPEVHRLSIQLLLGVAAETARPEGEALEAPVLSVLKRGIEPICGGATSVAAAKKLNTQFLETHGDSMPHRLAAAQAALLIAPGDVAGAAALLKGIGKSTGTKAFTLATAVRVHKALRLNFKDENAAEMFKKVAAAKFPVSTYFH